MKKRVLSFWLIAVIALTFISQPLLVNAENVFAEKKSFDTSRYHSAAIMDNGDLYVWGKNNAGQVGDGTQTNRHKPVYIMSNVKSVSVGQMFTLALQKDGTLWAWGLNSNGEIGNGVTLGYCTTKPFVLMENVIDMSAGDDYSFIVTSDNKLYALGNNCYGQLGDNSLTDRTTPTKILDDVVFVCAGLDSAAIKKDGTLWTWGGAYYSYPESLVPVKKLDDVKYVTTELFNILAIKNDNTLWGWGLNSNGELCAGDDDYTTKPRKIMNDVKDVSTASNHTFLVNTKDELFVCGTSDYGQLGLGKSSSAVTLTPTKIMDNVDSVDVGFHTSFVCTKDGKLYACGDNYNGTLGDGTTTTRTSLVYIIDGLKVEKPPLAEGLFSYTISNGEVTITGCDVSASGKVTIPSKIEGYPVTIIDKYAFKQCRNITEISIPDSVVSIKAQAFSHCTSITKITIPASVTSLEPSTFFTCLKLTDINVDDANEIYADVDGVLFTKDKKTLVCYPGGKTDEKYVIPDGVTIISGAAFPTSSLKYIVIPGSVVKMNGAFSYINLENVIIKEGVTTISKSAFSQCKKLKSVTLPVSLKTISQNAFGACSSLTDVYYAGTDADWNNIIIDSGNDYLINAIWHYNVGKPSYNYSASPVYSTSQQDVLNDLKINTNEMLQNISCGNHPIKGPSVTFLGETFYLFEFDGRLDLNFEGAPVSVTVDSDTKTLRFLIGFENYDGHVDMSQENNSTAYWSESYQQVKSMYQSITGKKVDTTKLWNQFSSVRGQLKKMKSNLVVDADCFVAGYMEMSYETGEAKFTEGGIILEAGISGEFSAKVPSFPIAYVGMGLSASVGGKLSVAYENYISLRSELNAKLAANVHVGLMALSKRIAYIEGGLEGTLGADMHFASGKFKEEYDNSSPLVITVGGNIYLKGALLGYEAEEKNWPIGTPVQIYPKNDVSLMSYALFDEDTIDDVIANSTPLSRDYLYDVMLMSIDDSDKLYSDKSIYSYNAPVLTTLSDGSMLLLWVDDLGTKNDINKTSLMYSIYDGEAWSEANELFETGTYNGAPAIYNNGEMVHIVWSKAKTVFDNNAGLEDLIKDTELNYTTYANGTFSEPIVLTNNDMLEINYDIIESNGNIAVSWSENNKNNPYMSSGKNSLYVIEYKNNSWGERKLINQSDNAIDEIELYYFDDMLNCIYTMNSDDNSTDIYVNSNWLGDGSYINYYDGGLYYLSGNKIMSYNIKNKTVIETGLNGVNNFTIYEGNAYSLVSDGFACELYESINTNGTFSDWKQVTEFGRYIRDYSVTTDSIGEPVYALNLVDVNEGKSIYGASELAVCKASDINALELNAVYYDETNVAPSATLPLSIDVTNVGSTDIDGLNILITDDNGVILSNGAVNAEVICGESATIVYNYILPAELDLYDITVTVASAADERNMDNNSIKTSIGYADIMVQDVVVKRTENGAIASGTVCNGGYSDVTNVVLSVYDASYPDEVLATIDCAELDVGEEYKFTYDIPEKYLTLEDKMTMYGLCFKAGSDNQELNYANNTEKVVFGELTDYTVALVDGDCLLDIISVSEYNDYSVVKEGYTLEGWYTDPLFETGSKIDAIPPDISEDLTVFAKWIPMAINSVEYNNNSMLINAVISEELMGENGIIVLAVYPEGQPVSVRFMDISSDIECEFEGIVEAKNYTVKMFAWTDFENLKPLCSEVSYKVE